MGWKRKEVARSTPLPPSEYVDRLYYDTAGQHDAAARLVEDVGAGHVLLGTDHPFELADRHRSSPSCGSGSIRRRRGPILWNNAAGLLGLPVGAAAD